MRARRATLFAHNKESPKNPNLLVDLTASIAPFVMDAIEFRMNCGKSLHGREKPCVTDRLFKKKSRDEHRRDSGPLGIEKNDCAKSSNSDMKYKGMLK